jgi:hypothetical protein
MGEPQHLFDLSHGQLSPGRHPALLMVEDRDAAVADPRKMRRARYRLSGGRLHLGMVADIKSERWPASPRNGWPASVGIRNEADPERIDRKRACCQRAPKSPQLWAFKIPWPAGSVRIGDQPAV